MRRILAMTAWFLLLGAPCFGSNLYLIYDNGLVTGNGGYCIGGCEAGDPYIATDSFSTGGQTILQIDLDLFVIPFDSSIPPTSRIRFWARIATVRNTSRRFRWI